ncbi:hypothetical protein T484DRAFT_1623629 [Baffinella frigidus]|nr:hypothetical protein T484DRAFT_1623629 [Cryptophyta sp. CCMP2293]
MQTLPSVVCQELLNPKPQTPNPNPQSPDPKPQTPTPTPNTKHQTPNHKLSTPNPKPKTQNPKSKPQTLNPKPQTAGGQPSARHPPPPQPASSSLNQPPNPKSYPFQSRVFKTLGMNEREKMDSFLIGWHTSSWGRGVEGGGVKDFLG